MRDRLPLARLSLKALYGVPYKLIKNKEIQKNFGGGGMINELQKFRPSKKFRTDKQISKLLSKRERERPLRNKLFGNLCSLSGHYALANNNFFPNVMGLWKQSRKKALKNKTV